MRTWILFVIILFSASATPFAEELSSEQEVGLVFSTEFHEHWVRADAEALSNLWTPEGEWMSLVGSRRIVRGRTAIAGVWEVGLEGRESPDQLALEIEVTEILLLSPEAAQVDLLMTFGSQNTGLMKEAMVAILQHDGQRWRIRSARVARIPDS